MNPLQRVRSSSFITQVTDLTTAGSLLTVNISPSGFRAPVGFQESIDVLTFLSRVGFIKFMNYCLRCSYFLFLLFN